MVAGLLLAATALTGCSFGKDADSKPGYRTSTQQVASEQLPTVKPAEVPIDPPLDASSGTKDPALDLLMGSGLNRLGVCVPEYYGDFEDRDFARACLEFYEAGKVALVNFGSLSDRDATGVANELEEFVEYITGGLVRTSFEAIPASRAAKLLLKELAPRGCTTAGVDYLVSAAWVAADRMSKDLEGIDKVIGLNPYPTCDDLPVGGVAFNDDNNLYAEVIGQIEDPKLVLGVAAHEFFHLLAIGHSGVVEYSPHHQQLESLYQEGETTVDLRAYLEGDRIEYRPYGNYSGVAENSIMGNSYDPDPFNPLSAFEMGIMQWPHAVLGKQPDPEIAVTFSELQVGSAVEYTTVDKGRKYAQIELDKPFELARHGVGQSGSEVFDKLTVALERDPGTRHLAINLRLLAQVGNHSAVIGRLVGPGESMLDIDGHLLTITIDNQVARIEFSR